jgi:hypothetical protein
MRVMDGTGDSPVAFDTEDPVRMETVHAEFDRLVASGAMVYDDTTEEQIRKPTRSVFEETDALIVVPHHVGG